MGEESWRWADAWIFVSVIIAGGAGQHRRAPSSRRPEGVRLTDVLFTANHLNRTLPGRNEVEAAVRRLVAAELITVTDGWFRITPAGRDLWRTRPHGGLGATVETVQGVLNRRPVPAGTDWTLSEDEHTAAVQEYNARFAVPTPRRSPDSDPR